MVCAGIGGGGGRLGVVGRGFGESPGFPERAVHLVGRYLVVELPAQSVTPGFSGGIEQGERSKDVHVGEVEWSVDGAVYMALGGEVQHGVYAEIAEYHCHCVGVRNIGLYKAVVRQILYIFEVGEIPSIGKRIHVHH